MKKVLSKKFSLHPLLDIILLVLVPLLLWFTLASWTQVDFFDFYIASSMGNTTLFYLNFLPILLFLIGLYFATGRSLFSALVTAGFFLLMGQINYIKMLERGEPFVPADIRLVREALHIVGQYGTRNLILIFGGLALVILLGILAFFFFRPVRMRLWVRLPAALAAGALLFALTFSTFADDDLLHQFDLENALGNRMAEYSQRGFVYSFIHDITALSVREPEHFNPSVFRAKEEGALPIPQPQDLPPRPNVVMIMAEAFSDLTLSPVFDFSGRQDPLEHFLQIQEDSLLSGHLVVDVLGGGTIFTEFAALTGISPMHLSPSISPYEFIRTDMDSIVWQLRNLGYTTMAVHPFHGWFYNRINVFERLGFETFLYGHGEHHFEGASMRGGFVSEEATFDALLEIIDAHTPGNDPLFLFCTTIQNHGGYMGKYSNERLYLFDTDAYFDEDNLIALDNFIYGLFDVDRELARLVARLDLDPEPFVLIYFSDHEPSLRRSVFYTLGWGDIFGAPINALEAFSVPFFIWQNEAARQQLDLDLRLSTLNLDFPVKISAFHLAPLIMELLDFNQFSPFFSHVNDLRGYLPIMRPGVFGARGEALQTGPPPQLLEILSTFHGWSYYKVFHQSLH